MTVTERTGTLPAVADSILLSSENIPRPVARISKKKNPTVEEALVVIEYCDSQIKQAYHKHNYEGANTLHELQEMSFRRSFGLSATSAFACGASGLGFALAGTEPIHFAVSQGSLLGMILLAIGPIILNIKMSTKESSRFFDVIAPRKSKKIRAKARIENTLKTIKQEEFQQIERAMLTLVAPSLKAVNDSLAHQNRELIYASSYAKEGFVLCDKAHLTELGKWQKIGRMVLSDPVPSDQLPVKKTKKPKLLEG